MKIFKKALKIIVIILAVAVGLLYITGNKHIIRGIQCTYLVGNRNPDIDDMKFHHLRIVEAKAPTQWRISKSLNKAEFSQEFLDACDEYETSGYLVIWKDSIVQEKYFGDTDKSTPSNSFSMAKSCTAIAIGVAIDEGKIKSVDQKAGDFLPWLNEGQAADLTIKDILTMSSGINFGEDYLNPFGFQARAYFGDDLKAEVEKYNESIDPGEVWRYEGGNSILLGMILKEATGQDVSTYFSEKIWSKIGAENDAFWKLDADDGIENTFTSFYSNPRDFARLGKLYLNEGEFALKRVVSKEYVQESLKPINILDSEGENVDWYGYHWWLGKYKGKDLFECRGIRGQYIIVIPEDDLIIVRVGHHRSGIKANHAPTDREIWIEEAYNIID